MTRSRRSKAKKAVPVGPYQRAAQRISDRIEELEELDAMLILARPPGNPPWQGLAANELRKALEMISDALVEDIEITAQYIERLHHDEEEDE
jgi:hypothetical protein